jgi:cell shape-determining protein MreC
MGNLDDLLKIERSIIDLEIKISTIVVHLESIERDIGWHTACLKSLEENIQLLKQDEIICTLARFKKSKMELNSTLENLKNLNNEKDADLKKIDKLEKERVKLEELCDNIKQKIENNTVIYVNFGKKNGQSRNK